ncbi:IS1182 family transposase [Ktedonobacter racemifer]|uniref:Transposase IS4 family protein n=1 Tax=Ktedonobacter racemifer DSM 44963 TaxID=485913 RepID=D6U3P9_KTERA|nr:IS1182 family transposase [Ktedonobacter racemifer]EFH83039.1 transposase IS4 family protein [Ktedonobacter racemifer DSM 44963]
MSRVFKTVDYAQALDLTVRLGDCLPPDHLAHFVVDSVAQLDLSALYAQYGSRGGQPYAPEMLLSLLLYGYATGVFSSRKIERATYEAVPFRFIAGNLYPDHDTLATFRRTFLLELKNLFVQVLLLAQEAGVLKLGTISLDGTKVHADASKRKAVSYKRLLELEIQLQAEVEELFALSEQGEQPEAPDGLVVRKEIARRQDRLVRLAEAKAVLEARAKERVAVERVEYEAKLAQREERERMTGRRSGGRPPTPPTEGPRDGDQYNFTDPESRIMKSSTHAGFEQDYNAQVAVDQKSLLIVGCALSNHPNDSQEAEPALSAIPAAIGTPEAVALDAGYFGPATLAACAKRSIEPYIATGRDPHHPSWQQRFAPLLDPPPEEANPRVKMAYKLKTALGKVIYRARKYTVEPVIGIIKEILGFRQFSLRGLQAAAGEWYLVCLAFNLKRFHTLSWT